MIVDDMVINASDCTTVLATRPAYRVCDGTYKSMVVVDVPVIVRVDSFITVMRSVQRTLLGIVTRL